MIRLMLIGLVLLNWIKFFPDQMIQSNITFTDVLAISQFGEWITFHAKLDIQPQQTVKQAYLFIQPEQQNILLEEVPCSDTNEINYQIDLSRIYFHPFSQIDYWFRIYLVNGQEFISPKFTYQYVDNRFQWQTLESTQFQVSWYTGDLEFGQNVMNVAQNGFQSALTYIPVNLSQPIRIFVYASSSDLQSAIQQNNQTWIAGNASPKLGIILVSIPLGPEARLELERQIPHEIMHLLQYQLTGDSYSNIPKWLTEGLASLAELYPNGEYQRSLKTAVDSDTLLPISSLCSSFPSDPSGVYLAYAQSSSFVRFLHQKYGTSGIYGLMNVYKDGVGCLEGFEAAFNIPLSQLEYRWQQEALGVDAEWLALENLSPYFLLFLLLTITPLAGFLLRVLSSHKKM